MKIRSKELNHTAHSELYETSLSHRRAPTYQSAQDRAKSGSTMKGFLLLSQRILMVIALLAAIRNVALAQDAASFGWNNMRAAAPRPLLLILARDIRRPNLAHTLAEYEARLYGTATKNVAGYFVEVSNGEFGWLRGGSVDQLDLDPGKNDIRILAFNKAVETGRVNLSRYDRNGDGKITPDELGVLVIANQPIAATAPYTTIIGTMVVQVGLSGVGDTANLHLLCHELSHQLGTIDIYGASFGYGYGLSLMSGTPAGGDTLINWHLDPWHKMQLGWVKPRVHDLRTPGCESLQVPGAFNSGAVLGAESPVILFDSRRSEYFMLEYRNPAAPTGSYDRDVPTAGGLVIWSVRQGANKLIYEVETPDGIANGTVRSLWYLSAPNQTPGQGSGTSTAPLFTAANGDIKLRWSDNSSAGVTLRVGTPSADGMRLPVSWTSDYSIYRLVRGSGFLNVPGLLSQIAVGDRGETWGINDKGGVFCYDALLGFYQVPGILSKIAVGGPDAVWGLTSDGRVYQLQAGIFVGTFVQVAGSLTQISVGKDGAMWGINAKSEIFRFDAAARALVQVPGSLRQIAVGNAGNVWGINAEGAIYRMQNNRFDLNVPGSLTQISVGGDGAVWGINEAQQIFHYDSVANRFDQIPGTITLKKISVGNAGNVAGINSEGAVYLFDVGRFIRISGVLSEIAVGPEGSIWGLNR
jgi:M6 family metalloprotease-like protein